MHSQYCVISASRLDSPENKNKSGVSIYALEKRAEKAAGCVRLSALCKSMLTAVVQPQEDSP